jgi:hypothetical protein
MGRKGERERDGERERGERCDFVVLSTTKAVLVKLSH